MPRVCEHPGIICTPHTHGNINDVRRRIAQRAKAYLCGSVSPLHVQFERISGSVCSLLICIAIVSHLRLLPFRLHVGRCGKENSGNLLGSPLSFTRATCRESCFCITSVISVVSSSVFLFPWTSHMQTNKSIIPSITAPACGTLFLPG